MERSLGRVFYTNGRFDSDNDYLQYLMQYHVGKSNLALAGKTVQNIAGIFPSAMNWRPANTRIYVNRVTSRTAKPV